MENRINQISDWNREDEVLFRIRVQTCWRRKIWSVEVLKEEWQIWQIWRLFKDVKMAVYQVKGGS